MRGCKLCWGATVLQNYYKCVSCEFDRLSGWYSTLEDDCRHELPTWPGVVWRALRSGWDQSAEGEQVRWQRRLVNFSDGLVSTNSACLASNTNNVGEFTKYVWRWSSFVSFTELVNHGIEELVNSTEALTIQEVRPAKIFGRPKRCRFSSTVRVPLFERIRTHTQRYGHCFFLFFVFALLLVSGSTRRRFYPPWSQVSSLLPPGICTFFLSKCVWFRSSSTIATYFEVYETTQPYVSLEYQYSTVQ